MEKVRYSSLAQRPVHNYSKYLALSRRQKHRYNYRSGIRNPDTNKQTNTHSHIWIQCPEAHQLKPKRRLEAGVERGEPSWWLSLIAPIQWVQLSCRMRWSSSAIKETHPQTSTLILPMISWSVPSVKLIQFPFNIGLQKYNDTAPPRKDASYIGRYLELSTIQTALNNAMPHTWVHV